MPFLASLRRLYHHLRYRLLARRYNRLVLEHCRGVPLLMLPGVFNGVLLQTGALLAEALETQLPAQVDPAPLALDLGTGSGLGAIFAARRGYRVVGVDLNPAAVRCARINVLLNQLEHRITIEQGDLFAPVAGQTFDLILFNPPYYRGTPRDDLDRAWRSEDVFERFVLGLPHALRPQGQVWLALSTVGACAELLALLQAQGFTPTPLLQHDLGYEVQTIWRLAGASTALMADSSWRMA